MCLEGTGFAPVHTLFTPFCPHRIHTLLEMKSRMLDVEPTTPMPRRLACDNVAARSRV